MANSRKAARRSSRFDQISPSHTLNRITRLLEGIMAPKKGGFYAGRPWLSPCSPAPQAHLFARASLSQCASATSQASTKLGEQAREPLSSV